MKKKSTKKKRDSSKGGDAIVFTSGDNMEDTTTNRPRNFIVTSATHPVQFSFPGRFGSTACITCDQTAEEETWPGGAVWDAGWCMAQLLAGMGCCSSKKKVTTTTAVFSELTGRSNRKSRTMELPDRVSDFLKANQKLMDGSIVALELGCGVGLSGLVAASSLRPALSVLTDLPVVVDKVTKPNVEQNTVEGPRVKKSEPIPYRLLPNSQTKVVAMPLTWGHRGDEEAVLNVLEQLGARKQLPITPRRRKKGASVDQMALLDQRTDIRYPDLILVGDVAYQHKPGAPSHFDALVETLLRMSDGHTVVIFATRIRMEASVDLLLLLRDCFDEVVQPPVQAHEIDAPAFGDVKHNLTIHFLQKKKRQKSLGRS